jgi:hypothetical protein
MKGSAEIQSYLEVNIFRFTTIYGHIARLRGAKTLDQEKLADYMHAATFKTIMGDIKFGPDGEWAEPRILTIQYQGVKGDDLDQFSKPRCRSSSPPRH